jgi:hypothetical protein
MENVKMYKNLFFREGDEYGEVSDEPTFMMGTLWTYRKENYESPIAFIDHFIETDDYKLDRLSNAQIVVNKLDNKYKELLSDSYHTFKELYDFRMVYNAALFNEWAKQPATMNEVNINYTKHTVHKSWRHHDGELCFGGGWFIVSAKLPTGLISNHYETQYWDLFKIPEVEKALFEFDGHTSVNVLERLKSL